MQCKLSAIAFETLDLQRRLPRFRIDVRPYDYDDLLLEIVDIGRQLIFRLVVTVSELKNDVCRHWIAFAVAPED